MARPETPSILQKLIPVWSAELSGEQRVIEEKNVNFNPRPQRDPISGRQTGTSADL